MMRNRLIQMFSLIFSRIDSCQNLQIGVGSMRRKCGSKPPSKQNFSPFFLGIMTLSLPVCFATSAEAQVSQAIKAKEAEGKQYVSSMNKAQQAYYSENTGFTSSIANLGLGMKPETPNYKYSISTGNKAVFNYGVSQQSNLKNFVGGVFLIGTTTRTIMCQTNAASKTKPPNPINKNGTLACGVNTVEVAR
ncbi:hypothetical protein C7B67_15445 [filamentous cyanobacterium Phorm 6]|nr:hypothetical protein C7B67_15445 [filamentous cyanobacterium Phorm 6]